MWIEEITLTNIKCFEGITLKFGNKDKPCPWISLVGENGVGKSTILQAIGLALAGPEGAAKLLNPKGWVRDADRLGQISITIRQDANDTPEYTGESKTRKKFTYKLSLTGEKPIKEDDIIYYEPTILSGKDRITSWLRANAFKPKISGTGWFAAGYGAFRRLTRKSEIIVPSLQMPDRYTNFLTQFDEGESLASFERWLVYLDYKIVKDGDKIAEKQKELGIEAINKMLPEGNRFDSVTSEGRILFDVKGKKVPTIALSDGFRSVLALSGDLVWRLLEAFPQSKSPLQEHGVVLIDELDIHLHPTWQRDIAGRLRETFPNIQFIIAAHSPFIAAGAGVDAYTYKVCFDGHKSEIKAIDDIAFNSIEKTLQSEAFQLVSPYSPDTQAHIDKYFELKSKRKRTPSEEKELQQATLFAQKANQVLPDEDSLEYKMRQFIKQKLNP